MPAFAGIRVVGNGGGYAEMQAIWINSQLKHLSKACLQDLGTCGLSAPEGALLQEVLHSPFLLEMNPDCSAPFIQPKGPSLASISSCALYETDTIAKSFSEIAAWTLAARLVAVKGLSADASLWIGRQVFSSLQQQETKIAIQMPEGAALFHFLSVQQNDVIHSLVSLEGLSSTVDITDSVLNALSCATGTVTQWSLSPLGARETGDNGAMIESEAFWSCSNGDRFKSQLQVYFQVSQNEILDGSIRMRMVLKEPL